MNFLDPLFRWEPVTKLFRDDACLQAMLDFESALARAESSAGVIPSPAASAIVAKCRAELFDQKKLAAAAALAGNLAIPLVKQLRDLVAAENKDAADFVHWGATSQDAIDTGMILQCRDALALIAGDANELCNALASLADDHRATSIVGRTWMQHAVPTTLGMKFAGWLDALGRHRERLRQTQKTCLVLQFGGAVGTLAALGSKGDAVAKQLAKELNLALPQIPWHSHRDRMAEIATTLGLLAGTLGKIARDISIHAQTEIDELREPVEDGRGGSSTMPHKRNPVASAAILSAAIRVPALVSTMLSAMAQEDERGIGGWHAEWETLPEIVCLAAGALHHLTLVVPHLEIDVERMRRNLDLTNGLILSEAITAALGEKIGRLQARQLIDAAAECAAKERISLRKVLDENSTITKHLSPQELERLFDPRNYSGGASQFIDSVIEKHRSDAHSRQAGVPFIDIKDVRMHYQLDGPAGAATLVLSNSLGTNLSLWEPQLPAFAKDFRVLRYDSRGHGQTSATPGEYSVELLARDVLRLLDALKLGRVHFCGLSIGGMTGMWLAANTPERLNKLVLCNTAPKIGNADAWDARIKTVREGGTKVVSESVIERWFTPEFRAENPDVVVRTKAMIDGTSTDGYTGSCAAVRDFDFWADVGTIRVPTLIIAGAHDAAVPPADGQKLAHAIPGARYTELSAAHISNIEDAARFTAEVSAFLK